MNDQEFFKAAVDQYRAEYDHRKATGKRLQILQRKAREFTYRTVQSYTMAEREYFYHYKAPQIRENTGVKKCNVPECLERQRYTSLCGKHSNAIRAVDKLKKAERAANG